jgi:hypothetical protein
MSRFYHANLGQRVLALLVELCNPETNASKIQMEIHWEFSNSRNHFAVKNKNK